jgi:hypothetical protein
MIGPRVSEFIQTLGLNPGGPATRLGAFVQDTVNDIIASPDDPPGEQLAAIKWSINSLDWNAAQSSGEPISDFVHSLTGDAPPDLLGISPFTLPLS